MTDKEKAIVMAYTGACMLTGDKWFIFHKYVEDILHRPIMTHEFVLLEKDIKEAAKPDFIKLCAEVPDTDIIKNEIIGMLTILKKAATETSHNDTMIIDVKEDSFKWVIDKTIDYIEKVGVEHE